MDFVDYIIDKLRTDANFNANNASVQPMEGEMLGMLERLKVVGSYIIYFERARIRV
jgi:ubiquitin C-terminal hydrolase